MPRTRKRKMLVEQVEQQPADFWMLGDSIIHWAGHYAREQGRRNLGLSSTLGWYGIRGMSWVSFRHNMQLEVLFSPPPKGIFIHLGGNDVTTQSLCRIFTLIRSGLRYLRVAFPNTKIIWLDVLPRLIWVPGSKEDKKRRRINRFGRQVVGTLKGEVLTCEIDNMTPGFFRQDGIHLSQIGLEMLLDAIKDKLVTF